MPTTDAFRRAVGHFTTGVAVVTTRTPDGPAGITANSLTSVSLDPLLVLVCVERTTRFHEAVRATGTWGVSVLASHHEGVARLLAAKGAEHDPSQVTLTHAGPLTGAPLVSDALATFECRTWSTTDGGDHTVVVGEVLDLAEPSPGGVPLLYSRGRFTYLDAQV